MSNFDSIEDFIDEVLLQVSKQNYIFLRNNSAKLLKEIVGLIFDIEEIRSDMYKVYQRRKEVLEYSMMYPAILFIWRPHAANILTSLLLGNILSIYYSIRVMLEALIGAYLLDIKYGIAVNTFRKAETNEFLFFNPCALKDSLANVLQSDALAAKICDFWKLISSFWLHALSRLPKIGSGNEKIPSGIFARILVSFIEKGKPPSYAFTIPTTYTNEDLEELNEILHYTSYLRKLLKQIISKWWISFIKKHF
ncbi:MAG: hypothetical protein ACTSUJ_05460 [Candidatus Njordarchaeales archaeon]